MIKYIKFTWLCLTSIFYNLPYILSSRYYKEKLPLKSIAKWRYMDKDIMYLMGENYNWSGLKESISTFGYVGKPIVLYSVGINEQTGTREYLIKDGNHRFTILSDLYDSEKIISVYIKKWNEKDEDLYSHNKRMDVYRRKCMETMVKGREILIDKTKKLKK